MGMHPHQEAKADARVTMGRAAQLRLLSVTETGIGSGKLCETKREVVCQSQ